MMALKRLEQGRKRVSQTDRMTNRQNIWKIYKNKNTLKEQKK